MTIAASRPLTRDAAAGPRLIDEQTWARMPWHARQQWLKAATQLRRQVEEELDALARDQRSRMAQLYGALVTAQIHEQDDAAAGPARLEELRRATRPRPRRRTRTTTHSPEKAATP